MRTTKNSNHSIDSNETAPLDLVGFGSQGKAWALNLRDSKQRVRVLLRKGSKSCDLVNELGFEALELNAESLKNSQILLLLIPDSEQTTFLTQHRNDLNPNTLIIYAHGFTVSSSNILEITPHLHHGLLAPKAIASEVRFQYETKGKLLGVHDIIYANNTSIENQKMISNLVANIGKNLGLTSNYKSTFHQETKADLFSEQSLLCSLLPYGAKLSFEKLVDHGIDPKLALLECFLELRSISKALVDLGPEAFFNLISPNALLGSEKAYELFFDQNFSNKLDILWQDIECSHFQKSCLEKSEEEVAIVRGKILTRFKKSTFNQTFINLKSELT